MSRWSTLASARRAGPRARGRVAQGHAERLRTALDFGHRAQLDWNLHQHVEEGHWEIRPVATHFANTEDAKRSIGKRVGREVRSACFTHRRGTVHLRQQRHGAAVSVGMMYEAELAMLGGRLSEAEVERLIGLGLILLGVLCFGLVYLLWRYAPALMPAPANLPRTLLPIASPLNCMLPVAAITASVLVLIGIRRVIFPDD